MKTLFNSKSNKEIENYGGEFSILTSHSFEKSVSESHPDKSAVYTGFLYLLSILSIACWIISLNILPFGDLFQFLLGAVVLSVNFMVFKWTKF